jgi:hypothetical protein
MTVILKTNSADDLINMKVTFVRMEDMLHQLLYVFQNSKSVAGAEDVIGPAPNKVTSLPIIPPEVMRTASERHQKGLMSPYIYQILTQVGVLHFAE